MSLQSSRRAHFLPGLFLALSLLFPLVGVAQERVSFQISPPVTEDSIEPGVVREYTIRVTNNGDSETLLRPTARNIVGMRENGEPEYSHELRDQEYQLASWITFKESELSVAPKGGTALLHVRVDFPGDAQPGSHMAGVFLVSEPSFEIKNGSAIGFEIASILSFRIAGEIIEKPEIREFYASKSVYGEPAVDFTVRIENEGNVLIKPSGFIDITNMFGKKVGSIAVNENFAGVFPGVIREFQANWTSEDVEFGRYEAVLALIVRGESGDQTISRIVQFWVLPMDVLTPILVSFLVLVLVVYVLLRLYVRRQLAGIRRADRPAAQATKGLSRLAVVVIALLLAIILGLFILFFYFG